MKRDTPDDQNLWSEALDLIIRLQSDRTNAVTVETIRTWRRRSPAHDEAWREAAEIHGLGGQALAMRSAIRRQNGRSMSRRSVLAGGAAAAVGIAFVAAPSVILRAKADEMTGTGEIRRVPLPDGSVVTLGPDSAIGLDFGSGRRGIALLAGMGFFEIAQASAPPFQVSADEVTAATPNASFEMSKDAGFLSVSVDGGSVGLSFPIGHGWQADRVEAGERLTFDEATSRFEKARLEQGRVASWRDRVIFADRERISSLVARISRWQPGRVVIADPGFGNQRVSGVYDLSKPLMALEAVVAPYGGTVRSISSYLTVISRF